MAMDNLEAWLERLKLIEQWDEARDGPLVHRKNLDNFVAVENVTSWDEWQNLLGKQFQHTEWLFRGHARSTWRLEPSLERAVVRWPETDSKKPPVEHWMAHPRFFEEHLLFTFQRRAHHYVQDLPGEDQLVDWLALMQHYGVPTRLLDWTSSPHVALYFALEDSLPDSTCAVWALDSGWLVDVAERVLTVHDPEFAKSREIKGYHRYLNKILYHDNPSVVVVVNPIRMNERAAVQQGMFTCDLGEDRRFDITLLDMIISTRPQSPKVWKIVLSTSERVRFLRELGRMNINGDSLFPGLDGFARSIRVRLLTDVDARYEIVGWKLRQQP